MPRIPFRKRRRAVPRPRPLSERLLRADRRKLVGALALLLVFVVCGTIGFVKIEGWSP